MKTKYIKYLIIFLTIFIFGTAIAQAPPPNDHGSTGDEGPGGSAPVGEGLIFLLTLGAAYGTSKKIKVYSDE